ncbi:MAG TPA: DUF3641 domain-containing protein [Deltaproteobacteria bacterium]|nr:DUF3641 domain-containing protein [Deltaproteobacteria bacterium]HIJ76874.1 DUF3641 domain-containing protein [Deltaproteobacteria bacterium]
MHVTPPVRHWVFTKREPRSGSKAIPVDTALRPSGANFHPETPDKRPAVSDRERFGVEFNGLFIREFDFKRLSQREITVRNHCFACCAGAGSSCQGALDT